TLPAAEVEDPLLAVVADDQLPSLEGPRQYQDQRRDHAAELLAVAVGQEEAPRLVEQEVVEVALQLLLFQPQLLLDGLHDPLEERLPGGVGQAEAVRLQAPDAAHLRIDDGLLALAVGGLLAVLLQLLRLDRGERHPDGAEALDLEPGQHGGGAAAGAERAGPIDLVQR